MQIGNQQYEYKRKAGRPPKEMEGAKSRLQKDIMEQLQYNGDLSDEQLQLLKDTLVSTIQKYSIEKEEVNENKVAMNNTQLIEEFLETKRVENKSYNTIYNYGNEIQKMFLVVNKPCNEITTTDIRKYLDYRKQHDQLRAVSINNIRMYLMSFFKWCSVEEHIEKNPMDRIGVIKTEKKVIDTLTNEQVHDICRMLVEGISSAEIARKYNVDPGTIYDIKARNTYTAISRNYNLPKTKRFSNKLSEDIVHEVCRRLERGDRIVDIYTELHIDRSVVNSIKSGRYFKHISSQYNIPKVKPQKSFTDEELHDICRRLENKEGVYSIAKYYNIDPAIVAKIKNESTHKDISSQYNIPKPGEQYIRDEYIRLICLLIENGDSDQCIYLKLKKYGVTKAIVNNIRNHKSGNHISKNFNF